MLAFLGKTGYGKHMLDAIFLSLGSLFVPTAYTLPPEHRSITVEASVQESFRTDWDALRNDWLTVGNDLAVATTRVLADGKTTT